jgi:putative glutamine amidotransferase
MQDNKLVIGLSYTDWRFDEYSHWVKHGSPSTNPDQIEVVVLTYEKNNYDDILRCNGLVMSGGKDINPDLYGKGDQIHKCGTLIPERDEFELKLIEKAFDMKIPLLGICRGEQLINISKKLNGSLFCDIVSMGVTNLLMHANDDPKGPRHEVKIEKDSLLYSIMGKDIIEVNSFHHQSVDKVGDGLCVSSRSSDGIIESLEWTDKSIEPLLLLVQWHPERLIGEESSQKLLDYFYNTIKTKRK